jgi:hypothetical protein
LPVSALFIDGKNTLNGRARLPAIDKLKSRDKPCSDNSKIHCPSPQVLKKLNSWFPNISLQTAYFMQVFCNIYPGSRSTAGRDKPGILSLTHGAPLLPENTFAWRREESSL